jgi:hypothetical protein
MKTLEAEGAIMPSESFYRIRPHLSGLNSTYGDLKAESGATIGYSVNRNAS